uniref:RRM domain-containing protein n=1 Tax=Plectus sambesii TaxID=2011161 RepID=A0A914XAI5_9BILA
MLQAERVYYAAPTSRSKSRDRKRRRRSRSNDHRRRKASNPEQFAITTNYTGDRSRERDRRRKSRSRSRERPVGGRFRDDRRRRSPPMGRRRPHSPPRDITAGGRRLPGPERRDVMPFTARRSPPRNAKMDMTSDERDQRTVFIMQLARQSRPRDLEEFFSAVGHVRDVRIITDSKTRRSKGIAYVEFWEIEAVSLALGLNNQRLLGAPLIIQPTMAEKNRAAAGTVGGALGFGNVQTGPMKLYIGSLHYNITQDMLKGIFEPFGRIDAIELATDEKNESKGFGYVTFHHPDDGKRAMEQLNGFELAGRPIKVGPVTDQAPTVAGYQRHLDSDEMDRAGVDLGASGRLHLMAKLAEGTGMQLPQDAQTVLMQNQQIAENRSLPAIATQCFMLSNMFDPSQENDENWDQDIRDDVIEECTKNGGVWHIFVDKASAQGNVYVKCPSVAAAVGAVNSLHGRWFAGKVITANYVPVANYHQLFPDAMKATASLYPSYRQQTLAGGHAGAIY